MFDWALFATVMTIAVSFTPMVMTFIKFFIDGTLIKPGPDHDGQMRIVTQIVTGLVGAVILYQHGYIHTVPTAITAIIVCLVYAILGGPAAMGIYAHLNGWFHQTPPGTAIKNNIMSIFRKAPQTEAAAQPVQPNERQPY